MNPAPKIAIAILAPLSLLAVDCRLVSAFPMHAELTSRNSQTQATTISLNAEEINEPHFLRIRASSSLSYLSGSIFCNGRIIKHLNNGTTEINVAPYLQAGKNSIEILGRYSPSVTNIEMELTGPNQQISQSTSGNGVINSNIFINVR